jgi:glycosyltransferase involved in cell wall biosynthesis
MKFSLIICTYMRPEPLRKLLESVETQSLYPSEILIVDGSRDDETKQMLAENQFERLQYFKVTDANRGLTRQRNYGIARVAPDTEVVCFLDDDIVLEPDYFKNLIDTYTIHPDALGVGGFIIEPVIWEKSNDSAAVDEFQFDGWKRPDGSRFVMRKRFGLDSDVPPGFSPGFSHGRSVGFLPPSGKIYQVEQLMGGVSSFRKYVFDTFSFSEYFEGYGLYEDADFTLRVAKTGKLYLNTNARLYHYHDDSGRPNKYSYGKMVVRNGWYVWRIKNPKPTFKDRIKWHAITLLLTGGRFLNVFTTSKRKEALTEALGRASGWIRLFFNKPLHQ